MKRIVEILTIPFWIGVVIYDLLFPKEVDVHKYFQNQSKNQTLNH